MIFISKNPDIVVDIKADINKKLLWFAEMIMLKKPANKPMIDDMKYKLFEIYK